VDDAIAALGPAGPRIPLAFGRRFMLDLIEVRSGASKTKFDPNCRFQSIDQMLQELRSSVRRQLAEKLARLAEFCGPCDFRALVASEGVLSLGGPRIGAEIVLRAGLCAVPPEDLGWGPESLPGSLWPSSKEVFAEIRGERAEEIAAEWLVWETMES
jgi:hypothetical protein